MIRPDSTWVSEDALLLRWEPQGRQGVSLLPQLAFHEIRRQKLSRVVDLIPGACTLLVCFDTGASESRLRALETRILKLLARLEPESKSRKRSPLKIPMRYDGSDLEFVAEHMSLSVPSLMEWHSSTLFQVAFIGFAPGFPYLVPTEGGFEIPRLPEPRVRIPAGSVGLAGSFCGIYPREISGGWRLIGTCRARLFDPSRSRPSLLAPGDLVRFVPA